MGRPSEDTAEFNLPTDSLARRPVTDSARVECDVWGASDVGLVRERNEDHYLVVRYGRFLDALCTNLPEGDIDCRLSETGYGMVVADGLGGHAAGSEASRLAINTLLNLALETSDWVLRFDSDFDVERVLRRASARFEMTSAEMTAQAAANPALIGFATTMTMAMSVGSDLFIAHVGDSRAYLLRGERLHQLTTDHTRIQELIDAGLVREASPRLKSLERGITKLLGDSVANSRPSVRHLQLADGDRLLLCTDGLTNMVPDEPLADLLRLGGSSEESCRRLVQSALAAGGRDNVTVVLARYGFPSRS
jgi:serine/threonine protein phosphatase PrpC